MIIDQVASRAMCLVAGCIFMIIGCIWKVAALFVTIPDPVLGGLIHVTVGKFYLVNKFNDPLCGTCQYIKVGNSLSSGLRTLLLT